VFKHSRPRYSQTNGQIERFNQTLTRYLQKHIFEKKASENPSNKLWLKHINKVMYNYSVAKHFSTKKFFFSLRLQIPSYNTVYMNDNNEQKNDLDSTQADCDEITLLSNKETELLSEKNIRNFGFFKLPSRMYKNSLFHLSRYDISVGDSVIVAKDFDNNTKTKKLKLFSFFLIPLKL
ncbi:hypothetical protein CDIK_4471, partial [Cucumispora dikerogammari]